jgi:hypothetical protein
LHIAGVGGGHGAESQPQRREGEPSMPLTRFILILIISLKIILFS